jgi:hypothetical protein
MTNLAHIFDTAVAHSIATNREELPEAAHRRAGIRAVVEALRDEFEARMKPAVIWDRNSVAFVFNEILGSDADGSVAGGPTREDGPGGVEQAVPALTPAADKREWRPVCIWEPDGRNLWFARCDKQMGHRSYPVAPTVCPSCGKPISFKETP